MYCISEKGNYSDYGVNNAGYVETKVEYGDI